MTKAQGFVRMFNLGCVGIIQKSNKIKIKEINNDNNNLLAIRLTTYLNRNHIFNMEII